MVFVYVWCSVQKNVPKTAETWNNFLYLKFSLWDACVFLVLIEQGAGDISGIQQPQVVEEIPLQEGTSPKTLESVEEIQPDVYSLQGRSGDRLRSDVSYEQPSAMRSAVRARGSPPASEPVPMATDFGSSDSSWYPC